MAYQLSAAVSSASLYSPSTLLSLTSLPMVQLFFCSFEKSLFNFTAHSFCFLLYFHLNLALTLNIINTTKKIELQQELQNIELHSSCSLARNQVISNTYLNYYSRYCLSIIHNYHNIEQSNLLCSMIKWNPLYNIIATIFYLIL